LKSLMAGLLIICVYGLPAWSQTANELQQRSQEQERRAQEALDQRQKAIATPDVRLQSATPGLAEKLLVAESPCFAIHELKLQTNAPERWDWLLGHADGHATLDRPDPVKGRCVGAQGVQVVIDRLQNALVAQGYVTSRVLAPAQDLQPGN
jgi:hemolysin activation/secretion protein